MAVTIYLDGNISAGKSSLLQLLKQNINDVTIMQEPVDAWEDVQGLNLLKLYYSDPVKYAYIFQSYVMNTRFSQEFFNPEFKKVRIFERSLSTSFHIFSEMNAEKECYPTVGRDVLKAQYEMLERILPTHGRGYIYLRTEPKQCYERMLSRKRMSEDGVQMDYLQDLHQRYEKYFEESTTLPVLKLDGGVDFLHDRLKLDAIMGKIKKFILTIQHI